VKPPPIRFCPYCGRDKIKLVASDKIAARVPRCIDQDCRAVFFVDFSRTMRKKPKRKVSFMDEEVIDY
jgi:hypothetical protein